MLPNPAEKYQAFPPIDLPDRRWPGRTLTQAPIWLSTDLRDGNQALFEPMNAERKLLLFETLVSVGLKEIEVGFPAASHTDFNVVRQLIEGNRIPADVTIMVMTQARPEQIAKTVEAVKGARRAIVHLYNATAPVWRNIVFGLSVPEMLNLVREQIALLKRLTDACPDTEWILQYSPEAFCMTELPVSLAACNTAIRTWDATAERPIIINLPTTVEVATPNVFADQIEWMDRHLERRAHVVLSVHPHNDRGTGIACAELAMLAGAQRVEGCLFGNGERSGNLDLVTLALNLYTQGISPGLDFSDISAVARVVETCTSLPIHPRHPYVGDLVFTSFSGSHQDAIKKGFAVQQGQAIWQVPYLPIDPQDLGRTYDSIVRVNSQSGKGGIAFLLERDHGIAMPRRMQVEFSAIVQQLTDASETEIDSKGLWDLFSQTYLEVNRMSGKMIYRGHGLSETGEAQQIVVRLESAGVMQQSTGTGNGPIDALVDALGGHLRIDSFAEHSLGAGSEARAVAIVEAALPGTPGTRFGVGIDTSTITASIKAVLSAAARLENGKA